MTDPENKVFYIKNADNLEQVTYQAGARETSKGLLGAQINRFSLAAFLVGCAPFRVTQQDDMTIIEVERPRRKTYKIYTLSFQVGEKPVQMELKVEGGPDGTPERIACPLQTEYSVQIQYDEESLTIDIWKNDYTQMVTDLESYVRDYEKQAREQRDREQREQRLLQLQTQYQQCVTENEQARVRALEQAGRLADQILQSEKAGQTYAGRVQALTEVRQHLARCQDACRNIQARIGDKGQALRQAMQEKEETLQACKSLAEERQRLQQTMQEQRQENGDGWQARKGALLEELEQRVGKGLSRQLLLRRSAKPAAAAEEMQQKIRDLSKQQEELEEQLYAIGRQVERAVDFRTNELNQK